MNEYAATIANRLKPLVSNVAKAVVPAVKNTLERVKVPIKLDLALGDACIVWEGNLAFKFSDTDES